MSRVLVLTQSFEPHKIVAFERAVTLLFTDRPKAMVVAETDEVIYQKGSTTIRMPSVIALTKPVTGMKRVVKFSRINVLTRDGHRCQYCGAKKRASELNYDHVVPREQGGKTTWDNIVTACYPCNSRKANRTPEQAGMKLLRRPHKPASLPMHRPKFSIKEIAPEWTEYLSGYLDDHVA